MSSMLSDAIQGIISIFRSFVSFAFNTVHPGFTYITIGAVLVGIFMIGLGFDYIEYFTGGSKSGHVREDKK